MVEKRAVGKQTGGFMQTRRGTRPYRVETLLGKGRNEERPSDLVETYEPQQPTPEQQFEGSLVGMVSDEFRKHSDEFHKQSSIGVSDYLEGSSPIIGSHAEPITRHATTEKTRGPGQAARGNTRSEREPASPHKDTIKTSAELKSTLLPHQKRIVQKIRKQPGLVVAHGTGSGKTLSSIGAIVDLSPSRARVVVPAALKSNYEKEIKKHVKGSLPVRVESLQKAIKDGKPPRGDVVVFDEAHRIRNPQSKGHQMMRGMSAKKRLLLTASPVYNQPEDIAPLVNLAAGDKQLPEGPEFRKRFVQKPGRGLLTIINPFASNKPRVIRRGELGKTLNKWVDYHGNAEDGFPDLSERRVNVSMTKRQSQLHDQAWGRMPLMTRLRLKKGLPPGKEDLASINQFQAQTRQISSSEKKFSPTGEASTSPKVLKAVSSLSSAAGKNPRHKAVVYANYLSTLDDYSKELDKGGVPHASFRGDMPKKVRRQAIQDYNEGKLKALLVSGAGAEGLDLKGTRQVQVLEPHWNEERLRQVIGRARRYKSHDHLPPKERKVDVERYAARPRGFLGQRKGVEDVMYDTAEQKQRLNDQVLSLITKKGSFSGIKSIPVVEKEGPNEKWTVSLSKHPAARRGDHHDLRIVDPQGNAHSWAFNDMPAPGKGTYAAQMPTHSKRYALRRKPFSIPIDSYGGTRPGAKVKSLYVQPGEVISASDDRVRILRHVGKKKPPEELLLKRVAQQGKTPLWVLRNVRPKVKEAQWGSIAGYVPDVKQRVEEFNKEVDPEAIASRLAGTRKGKLLEPITSAEPVKKRLSSLRKAYRRIAERKES